MKLTLNEACKKLPHLSRYKITQLRTLIVGDRRLGRGEYTQELIEDINEAAKAGLNNLQLLQNYVEKKTGLNYRMFFRHKKAMGITKPVSTMTEAEIKAVARAVKQYREQHKYERYNHALMREHGVTYQQYQRWLYAVRKTYKGLTAKQQRDKTDEYVKFRAGSEFARQMVKYLAYQRWLQTNWKVMNIPKTFDKRHIIPANKIDDFLKLFKRKNLNDANARVQQFIKEYPSHEGKL